MYSHMQDVYIYCIYKCTYWTAVCVPNNVVVNFQVITKIESNMRLLSVERFYPIYKTLTFLNNEVHMQYTRMCAYTMHLMRLHTHGTFKMCLVMHVIHRYHMYTILNGHITISLVSACLYNCLQCGAIWLRAQCKWLDKTSETLLWSVCLNMFQIISCWFMFCCA